MSNWLKYSGQKKYIYSILDRLRWKQSFDNSNFLNEECSGATVDACISNCIHSLNLLTTWNPGSRIHTKLYDMTFYVGECSMREQTVTKLMLKFYQVMELSFCFSFVGSFKSEVGRFSNVLRILRFHLICLLLLHWGRTFLKGPSLVLGGYLQNLVINYHASDLILLIQRLMHSTSWCVSLLRWIWILNLSLKRQNSFLKFLQSPRN